MGEGIARESTFTRVLGVFPGARVLPYVAGRRYLDALRAFAASLETGGEPAP